MFDHKQFISDINFFIRHDSLINKGVFRCANQGVQLIWHFQNGYGASIIQASHSYGGDKGLWELAVLKGQKICYDSPITHDVEGYLTFVNAMKIIVKISKLKKGSK